MMKNSILFLMSFVLAFAAYAQQDPGSDVSGPALLFEESEKNFGDITQGEKVKHVFVFENSGTEPVIITNVQTTCGCTAPKWTRDPVMPGQKGEITVEFNSAGKMGRQNKMITIISNAPTTHLKIVTNVLPVKKES